MNKREKKRENKTTEVITHYQYTNKYLACSLSKYTL